MNIYRVNEREENTTALMNSGGLVGYSKWLWHCLQCVTQLLTVTQLIKKMAFYLSNRNTKSGCKSHTCCNLYAYFHPSTDSIVCYEILQKLQSICWRDTFFCENIFVIFCFFFEEKAVNRSWHRNNYSVYKSKDIIIHTNTHSNGMSNMYNLHSTLLLHA